MPVPAPFPAPLPGFIRAAGAVRARFAAAEGRSALVELAERGGYRLLFPRVPGPPEAVLVNTGGGLAGGDRLAVELTLDAGAEAVFTSQAAEKLYRSDGPDAAVTVSLGLAEGAGLAWLPQEQILFEGARLRRTVEATLAPGARLLLLEATVFGRRARGERFSTGLFRDRWRVRRGGRLVFAEEVALAGEVGAVLARPASAAGASAVATLLLAAPDAERRVEAARRALADAACEGGASGFDGLLVVRLLAAEAGALRQAVVMLVTQLTGRALPRVWQS